MSSTSGYVRRYLLALGLCVSVLYFAPRALAHGGVAFEDDLCVININFLRAHFTVFQPETRETEEFCEDIPDVTRSVFVMEYLHDLLTEMPVDFRIIRDVNDLGRFARWEDVQQIEDIEAVTVYYEPPRIESGGYFSASYTFEEKGTYIGVVTAEHPENGNFYNAVFYFRVGGIDFGTLPIFIAILFFLQLGYWMANGGWQRWQEKRMTGSNKMKGEINIEV